MIARRFYMIRHGETVANAKGLVAGGTVDTLLTERGRAQAEGARTTLMALEPRPTMLVHSGLLRSRETAEILNVETQLPIVEERRLAEQFFGDWVGQSWQNHYDRWKQGETPPHGESRDIFTTRVMGAFNDLLGDSKQLYLIISHGGVFDALLHYFSVKIEDVQNCHLYDFVPSKEEEGALPWDIWQCMYDDGTGLRKQKVKIDSVMVPPHGLEPRTY